MPKVLIKDRNPVNGNKVDIYRPLDEHYRYVFEDNFSKVAAKENEAIAKHREELFGPEVVEVSTEEYNEVSMLRTLDIPPYIWRREYTVHDKAKVIAQYLISNMEEILGRHRSILKRNKRRQLEKHK